MADGDVAPIVAAAVVGRSFIGGTVIEFTLNQIYRGNLVIDMEKYSISKKTLKTAVTVAFLSGLFSALAAAFIVR